MNKHTICPSCQGQRWNWRFISGGGPGDEVSIKEFCDTCGGTGIVTIEVGVPETDRTRHVRWERE